ncbi:pyridoxamine 5'-phosphate oxidase family protein [Jiulongibacter sp. NS-SX5]|uniref:pyridoxamine 5'-phosphate oxidase family protein n=1 Tax=Jiulongibacter sp. NS-SX5 TaxID=3463854 RepID=UPI004059CC84
MKFKQVIKSEEELRKTLGHAEELVLQKTISFIDEHCQKFIENASFLTIATADAQGQMDVSPKGDPAGFVKILDSQTLAIPDRPGNRKADTFTNILQNPNVGLLFLIPGVRETLRVNGTAQIVQDPEVLQLLECKGKTPAFAIIVTVKEAFIHCAKCVIRSGLWESAERKKLSDLPSLGQILVEHSKSDIFIKELDARIADDERTNLY